MSCDPILFDAVSGMFDTVLDMPFTTVASHSYGQ